MPKGKYVLRNITVLNILLAAAVFFMAEYSLLPLADIKVRYSLPAPGKRAAGKEVKTPEYSPPSLSDYLIVAEENLFHPERRIPPEKKEEQPLPKPEFVLYGTVIGEGADLAYLEDLKAPRTTPGRGKRQVVLKKGDMMSGFVLKEIDADKVVMTRGEEKVTVHIHDPERPKSRETVITTASTPERAVAGQPAHRVQPTGRAPSISRPQRTLPARTLTPQAPLPRTRAPMRPSEERVRQFFTK